MEQRDTKKLYTLHVEAYHENEFYPIATFPCYRLYSVVWTPMLETDNIDAANERESQFSDPRVQQFWDQNRIVGQYLSHTLKLNESIAWDVYLVYPPDHSWDAKHLSVPGFWMHQLNEEPTLLLDPPRLKKQYVQTLLKRTVHQ